MFSKLSPKDVSECLRKIVFRMHSTSREKWPSLTLSLAFRVHFFSQCHQLSVPPPALGVFHGFTRVSSESPHFFCQPRQECLSRVSPQDCLYKRLLQDYLLILSPNRVYPTLMAISFLYLYIPSISMLKAGSCFYVTLSGLLVAGNNNRTWCFCQGLFFLQFARKWIEHITLRMR